MARARAALVGSRRRQDRLEDGLVPAVSNAATATAAPRPLTGGAVMTAVSTIGVAIAYGLTTILIARALGPSGAGSFALVQSLLFVMTVGVSLGIGQGIVYFVGSGRWDPRWTFGAAMRFAIVMGLAGGVVGVVLRLLVPQAFDGLSVWLVAVALTGLPFALACLYSSLLALATDRYEGYVLPPLLQALATLCLAVPGAHLYGVSGAVVGMAVASVLVGTGTVVWADRALVSSKVARPRRFRDAISFGLKGYAANALQLLNLRLDLFVLAGAAPAAAVGQYSVAVSVTTVLLLLPHSLANVLYPRVARLDALDQESEPQLEMVETKSVRFASTVTTAGALVLALALAFLVVPVFGSGFRPSIALGLILLPGTAALALGSVLWSTIIGRGKPIYSLYASLVVAPITIGLYFGLIPQLEATGAALASTISYSLWFALAAWFYFRVTGRRVYRMLVPTRSEVDDVRALLKTVRARVHTVR